MKTIYGKATSEFCKLYLMEKFYILNALGDERYLNKRTDFISKLSYFSKMQKIIWINCSEFYIILLYGNFCFSLRTSRNVHLMNVQYMKLKVVYSTNIVF